MQRYRLPLLIGTLLTVVAVACAGGVNQGLATFVFALPEGASVQTFQGGGAPAVADAGDGGEKTPDKKPRTPTRKSKASYANGILGRNIFDSSQIGVEPEKEEGDAGATDLRVKLLATLVAEPEIFSSAFLLPEGNDLGGAAYGIGDKVLGAEIVGIERTLVRIKRPNGDEEVIKLTEHETKSKPKTSSSKKGGNDEGGIRKISDTEYEVDRALVDKHLANLEGISKLGRAIPHRGPDGQIDGYRLSGIRRGTAGEKLGIRNGDIVHAVNGYDLTSMSSAMKAFQELQSESSFSFELTRRGNQQKMSYNVR